MKTNASPNLKRFNHLIGETTAVYHSASLKLGLSDSVMQILYTISERGDRCPLTDICSLSGLSKQTVNSAIRKLEQDGVLRLEPMNAKSKMVILTSQGIELAKKTVVRVMNAENEIFASWSEEEVRLYLTLTERFLHTLQEKTEDL